MNASRVKSQKKQKLAEIRSLKRYNKVLFQQDLGEINSDDALGPFSSDPCRMAQTFQEIFESLLNLHAPLGVRKVHNEYAPWLTSAARVLMLKRDRMKKAATKNPQLWPR